MQGDIHLPAVKRSNDHIASVAGVAASEINVISAAVYFRVTSEDDLYVQAVPGFMSDMLDRARH